MNNSTKRWLLPMLASAVLLLTAGRVFAQPCSIGAIANPLNIELTLSPTTGTAVLTSADIVGFYSTGPTCDPLLAYKLRFFADQALTTFKGTYSSACLGQGSSITYDCSDVNTVDIIWVAIHDGQTDANLFTCEYDASTLSEGYEVRVTIRDKTAPDAAAPANLVVSTDASVCTATALAGIDMMFVAKAVYSGTAGTYTDNCQINLNITYELTGATVVAETTGADAGVETFNKGVTTVTYRIYDTKYTPGAGPNPRVVSFTVTVNDTENPSISCPVNQVRNTDTDVCTYTAVGSEFDPLSFSDNCPGASLSYSIDGGGFVSGTTLAGTVFPGPTPGPNVTTVEWKITDAAGNMATCGPFNVTVNDVQKPTITCPANATKNTDPGVCNYTTVGNEFNPTGMTDNCGIVFSGTNPSNSEDGSDDLNGYVFPLGITNVTWEVADANGNTMSCAFSVTVEDHEAPVAMQLPPGGPVTYQSTFNVNVAAGTCSQNVTWYRPNVDESCSPPPNPNAFATHCISDNCPLSFPEATLSEEQPIMPDLMDYPNSTFATCGTPPCDFFVDEGVTPYPYDPTNFLHAVTPVNADFPVGTTNLRYFVTDDQGNTTSIVISVTVNETELPVATCQPTLTLPLDAKGGVKITAAQVNNGSSDNCGILSMTVSPDTLSCGSASPQTLTLTVTDFNSNTKTCTTTVNIVDNLAPVVACPNNIVTAAGPMCLKNATSIAELAMTGQMNGAALTGPGQYQDNCGVTMITYLLTGPNFTGPASGAYPIPAGVNFEDGLTSVTYTFKDAKGNSTACSFNVSIEDLLPPTATCPANTTVNANTGGCIAIVNWTPPTFTDECDATPTVTSTHSPGSFFFYGPTQVTYTATDDAGNVGSCTFIVTVQDLQPPMAKCKDITVSLGAGGTVTVQASQVDNGSTDNCFYDYNPSNLSWTFNCTNKGPNQVTLSIIDGQPPLPMGNVSTCQAIITVKDSIAGIKDPSITNCAGHIPAEVDLSTSCDGILNADAYFAMHFTVTDNTLNSVPSCPLDFDLKVQNPQGAISDFTEEYPWTCLNVGVNTVTFQATDHFGNTTICTKMITVNDVTPPTIIDVNDIAPPTVTINCQDWDDEDFVTLGQITLADVEDACDDDCDDEISISYTDLVIPGTPPCNDFMVERTWEITDKAGNSTFHVQTFSIVDNEPPTFVNVQTQVNLVANNQNDAPACVAPFTIELFNSNISDNCTPANLSFFDITYEIEFPGGSMFTGMGSSVTENFPIGTSTVTFTAADLCGNESSISIEVNVDDEDGPVINEPFGFNLGNNKKICDSTFVVLNATGNCGNNFTWYRPTLQDFDFLDCSPHSVTEVASNPSVQSAITASTPFIYNNPPLFSIAPTVFFPVGSTTITYTATDMPFGNTTICSFTVKVVDTEAPEINCPGPQTLSISSGCVGITTVPSYLNGVQVTDNCPNNITLMQTPVAGTLLSSVVDTVKAGKVFTVKIKASDSQMNNLADSCTFTVTLVDGDAPVPDEPILPTITSFCGKDTVAAPSATDCDGTVFVTIYGTPSVTVLGILPPLVPGGPPRYIIPAGNYAITWSYTDPQMNTTTQLQSVNIFVDNIPPTPLCKSNFSVDLSPAGDYALSINEVDNGSFDQHMCGPVTLSLNPAILTCANINTPANVALVVTDVAGNVAQCVVAVTVNDVTAPILSPIPANDTVEACDMIPVPALISAVDVCDQNVSISYTQDTISYVNLYKYTIRRTWVAMDDSGNTSSGSQTIVIQDTEAPVFDASTPDTIIVVTDLNNLDCKDTVAINIAPFVSDCDSTTLMITNSRTGQGADYFEILSKGTYLLQFTAKDGNNNISTHTITIIVKDGTNPIAACINGVSVALQSSGTVTVTSLNINASSSDNCTAQQDLLLQIQRLDPLGPITNSITFNCDDADGVTKHPVKLYVQDEAGNESTCETFIIVQDNVFPQITSCPPHKKVQCTTDIDPSVQGIATATDNCSIDAITFSDSIHAGSGDTCYQVYRTWMAFDQANNLTTCVQIFSVQDTIKPVLSAYPPDDTISCAQGLPAPSLVTATDNCTQDVVVLLQQDTIDIAPGPCGQFTFTVVRTRTAVDDCGNEEVHTRLIRIVDNEIPQFLGMPDTIMISSADYPPNMNCTVPLSLNIGQYLTDCEPDSVITVTNTAPHGDGGLDISGDYEVGTYNIMFTATDACGNMNMDSIMVIVIDNSIPTVVCNDNVVISLGTNGEAMIAADDIDLGSNDNCEIDTMFLSQSLFDCQDLGINEVMLTVVDVNGNSNFCTVDVNVMLGVNAGFSLTTSGTPETYYGADDGTAEAMATGGSGNFSYTWSTGDTTATIDSLPAGIYTVTVLDNESGCLQVDTAMVEPGAKITVSVDNGEGCQGQTISIPVTVDNFINVTGFSFTLNPADPNVATILGVTNIHPDLVDELTVNVLGGGNLGIFWFDSTLTLPNGTVLFNMDVMFGTAAVGSVTTIEVTDAPVSLQFTQDSSGVSVAVDMVDLVDGEVEITCALPDLEIGGDIQTWRVPTLPVPGVDVTLTGTIMANQTTGLAGTYLFGVPDNANTTVKCFKDTPGNEGLTGSDVLLIKRHVLMIQQLTSPYQYVAADVSGDGNLSLIDYARIQEVALGTKQHITGSLDWRFIPKSYVFPTPDPLSAPIPDSISHMPVDMSYLDDDFVAVRMGDVNGSIMPTFTNDDVDDRSDIFRFRLEDRAFHVGETIEVPFRASDFTERSGYQLTINFDPKAFELDGIVPGVLPDMNSANFGTTRLDEGFLTTLWVTAEPVTVADGEVLFTLKFKVLRSGTSLAPVLNPGSQVTRAEAYNRDGGTMKLDFEFVHPQTGVDAGVFALYQNQPNPFNNSTTIGFRLPESGRAALRIFNASGQLVKTVVGNFEKGYNEVTFRRDEFGTPGVYYYELETPMHSDRKKMILID
ncbi:MAG: HYR domain-containing protein [Lewinellaceae bacterium]|nr:HYR domain-containing protein [Lewinellaceae bacterium]